MLHFAVKCSFAEASWRLLAVVELPLAELAEEESCRWTGGEVRAALPAGAGDVPSWWGTGHRFSPSPGRDAALPRGQPGVQLPPPFGRRARPFPCSCSSASIHSWPTANVPPCHPGSGLRPLNSFHVCCGNSESTAPASSLPRGDSLQIGDQKQHPTSWGFSVPKAFCHPRLRHGMC